MASTVTPEEVAYYKAHASDDRRGNQIAAATIGLALASAAVTARVISRLRSRAQFGLDDWMILVALAGVIAYTCALAVAVHSGEGLHIIFVTDTKGFIAGYVTAVVSYAFSVMMTKISLLLYYNRIFKVKWVLQTSIVMGIFIIAYSVALIFVAGFQCVPLSSMWTGKPGKCIDTVPPYLTFAIMNVITDFAILCLPIQPVLSLNMKLRNKIQVLGIFMTGGIVCVFGIVRCVAIAQTEPYDQSWTEVYEGIWSYVEMSVGVVAACLPTLGPLFKDFRIGSRLGKHTGSSRRYWLGLIGSKGHSRSSPSKSSASSQSSNSFEHQDHIAFAQKSYQVTAFSDKASGPPSPTDIPLPAILPAIPSHAQLNEKDIQSAADIV